MKFVEIITIKTALFSISMENLGKFSIIENKLHVYSDEIGKALERALKDLGLWADKMPEGYIFGAKNITEIVQGADCLIFYGITYEAVIK